MTETTRPSYRVTTFSRLGAVDPLSAVVRRRRVTIRPHTVDVAEWPDGRTYVTAHGQVIRQDGTPGSTARDIRYLATGEPSWQHDDPPLSEAPAWVQRIAEQVVDAPGSWASECPGGAG